MERDENEIIRTLKIKASELIKKFRHKEDRYNYCRQNGNNILY